MRTDQPVVAQAGKRMRRIALKPGDDIDRAGDDAFALDTVEVRAPSLLGDQQRADQGERRADGEDQRDPPGERGGEAEQHRQHPRHSMRTADASI